VELILIRHGRPERRDTSADPPLSAQGRQQAEATAGFLCARSLAGEPIAHVVASPLQRARQTAQPLAQRLGLEVEVVEGLTEIDPFGGAYVPAEEMGVDHHVVQTFMTDRLALFERAGGFEAFRAGVVSAIDGIIERNRGRRVAVYCHGTVVGSYLTALLGHDDPFVLTPDYCGIHRVEASSGGLRTVRSANETGHVRHLLGA
jgi:2,3-bisphosphoglycerate-dependent phosphoglycerate mutase